MDYYESAEGETISKKRAFVEFKNHGLENDFGLFLKDVGDKPEYDAQAVLNWLGY